MNQELPDFQAGFRKGRRTKDQIANIRWIIKKAREFQKKTPPSVSLTIAKAFGYVDCNKLWEALTEMKMPDHCTCLLRNLCAGQEAAVRTLCGTTDWFRIEQGLRQGCLLSPCLFNWYTEHIMRDAGLDELQAGIKMGNINNVRYADSTLMAESKEELKSLLMRVKKESEKTGLKLSIKKN